MSSKHFRNYLNQQENEFNKLKEAVEKKMNSEMKTSKKAKPQVTMSMDEFLEIGIENLTDEQFEEFSRMQDNIKKQKQEQEKKRKNFGSKKKGKRKQKGKKGKKGKGKKKKKSDDDDFLSMILEEKKESRSTGEQKNNISNNSQKVLLNKNQLNPLNEFQKLFGDKKSIKQDDNCKKRHREITKMFIINSKMEWSKYFNPGIHMERIKSETSQTEKKFTFVYDSKYLEQEKSFTFRRNTNDPHLVTENFYKNPWHIGTLLSLSEYYKMSNDAERAKDFVERAIYVYERTFLKEFWKCVVKGNAKIEYNHPQKIDSNQTVYPNMSFFILMLKHIHTVASQGTYATAFSLSKFLYLLDPKNDPCHTLLIIDFFACKNKNYTALQNFLETLGEEKIGQLPNLVYSRAISKYFEYQIKMKKKKKNQEEIFELIAEASSDLRKAIYKFPMVIPQMLDEIGENPTKWDKIIGRTFITERKIPSGICQKLIDCYISRNKEIWKDSSNGIVRWVEDVVKEIIKEETTKKEKAKAFPFKETDFILSYKNVYASEVLGKTPPHFVLENSHVNESIGISDMQGNSEDGNILLHYLRSMVPFLRNGNEQNSEEI